MIDGDLVGVVAGEVRLDPLAQFLVARYFTIHFDGFHDLLFFLRFLIVRLFFLFLLFLLGRLLFGLCGGGARLGELGIRCTQKVAEAFNELVLVNTGRRTINVKDVAKRFDFILFEFVRLLGHFRLYE